MRKGSSPHCISPREFTTLPQDAHLRARRPCGGHLHLLSILCYTGSSVNPEGVSQETAQAVLVVRNEQLHARPAAEIAKTAGGFQADIQIENLSRDSRRLDAKSLTDLLGLAMALDHRIRIIATGPDAREAIEALTALIGHNPSESG